jgi:hypothetical protein
MQPSTKFGLPMTGQTQICGSEYEKSKKFFASVFFKKSIKFHLKIKLMTSKMINNFISLCCHTSSILRWILMAIMSCVILQNSTKIITAKNWKSIITQLLRNYEILLWNFYYYINFPFFTCSTLKATNFHV